LTRFEKKKTPRGRSLKLFQKVRRAKVKNLYDPKWSVLPELVEEVDPQNAMHELKYEYERDRQGTMDETE